MKTLLSFSLLSLLVSCSTLPEHKASSGFNSQSVEERAFVSDTGNSVIARGYYSSVDTSNKANLRTTLHQLIDDHKRYPYTSSSIDTWDILELADQDPKDASKVLDIYKNASYAKAGGGNSNYNREHSWPKSYGFPKDGAKNYPYTDCHHLFICNSSYNSSRNNKPYNFTDPSQSTRKPTERNHSRGGNNQDNLSQDGSLRAWQVWKGRRGDVARALFYLDVRYEGGQHSLTGAAEPDLILTNKRSEIISVKKNQNSAKMGMLKTLLEWHRQDPVDALERHRNEVIYKYQGNRNPFIDHPQWVDALFN